MPEPPMDKADIVRLVQSTMRSLPPQLPASHTAKEVTTNDKLTVNGDLQLSPQALDYIKNGIGATSNLAGSEITYAQITADVATSATSSATATTVISGSSVGYDGSTVIMVEFFCPSWSTNQTAQTGRVELFMDGSSVGIIGSASLINNTQDFSPIHGLLRLTPSAGSHTFVVKTWLTSGGIFTIHAGGGGTNTHVPAFLRITRVSN